MRRLSLSVTVVALSLASVSLVPQHCRCGTPAGRLLGGCGW